MNRLDLPYFLTGAIAVVYYGEPRTTHDVDLVVGLRESDVAALRTELAADFFIDDESIRAGLREQSMFNAIHKEFGFKVDFWMLKDDEYARTRFVRRQQVHVLGKTTYLPTAEDVVITKLDWYKASDIDKHYFDALGVCRIQAGRLDLAYIENWCRRKTTLRIWQRVSREAGLEKRRATNPQ